MDYTKLVGAMMEECAAAIEQQAKRIAELEAVEQMRDEEIAVLREKHGNALLKIDELEAQPAQSVPEWSGEKAFHEGRGLYEATTISERNAKGLPLHGWLGFYEIDGYERAYWIAKAALTAAPKPESAANMGENT